MHWLIKWKKWYWQNLFVYKRFERAKIWIFLIKKREDAGTKHLNNPNALIECWNMMNDVYDNINDSNPIRKRKKN